MLTNKINQNSFWVQSADGQLASVLTIASPTAPLLVFSHGFAGNKNENGLFSTAVDYFSRHGFSTLQFDFRACGENKGSFKKVGLLDLVGDLDSIFRYIKLQPSLKNLPIGLIGFSLGAGIGLLSKPPVDTYLFWSPAIYTKSDMVPRYLPEINERGYVVKGGIEVGKKFIYDLDSDRIPNALSGVGVPTLLVHGTRDERIPHTSTQRAARLLKETSCESEILLVDGADHSFRRELHFREVLLSASLKWLDKHLPRENTTERIGEPSDRWPVPHYIDVPRRIDFDGFRGGTS